MKNANSAPDSPRKNSCKFASNQKKCTLTKFQTTIFAGPSRVIILGEDYKVTGRFDHQGLVTRLWWIKIRVVYYLKLGKFSLPYFVVNWTSRNHRFTDISMYRRINPNMPNIYLHFNTGTVLFSHCDRPVWHIFGVRTMKMRNVEDPCK